MIRTGFSVRLVATQSNARQPSRTVTESITVLGSGTGCDIILASNKVDEAHAVIVRSGKAAYLGDLGAPGGLTLNQRRIRWSRLNHGDIVTVGPFSFRLEIEGASESPPPDPAPFALQNDKTIGAVKSVDPILVIGSDYGCDVVLSDSTIRPRHGIVAATQEGVILRDLLRRRSVRRNGRRVNSEYLTSGDVIGIGRFELVYELIEESHTPSSHSEQWVIADDRGRYRKENGPAIKTASPVDIQLVAGKNAVEPETAAEELAEAKSAQFVEAELRGDAPAEVEAATPISAGPIDMMLETSESEDVIGRTRSTKLDQREHVIKARITAAHNALELRAKKIEEEMQRERERLKAIELDLQKKAQRVLHVAQEKQKELESREQERTVEEEALREELRNIQDEVIGRGAPRETTAVHQNDDSGEIVQLPLPSGLERVFGGEFEPAANTTINADATERQLTVATGVETATTAEALQQQAADLADQVRVERLEMDKIESGLESLRFEVERLGSLIARGREKHETQQAQLEARLQSLRANRQEILQEREELTGRLRQLDANETALRVRLQEADRTRLDVEQESQRLAKLQEEFEQRRRDLRAGLEAERHRLQLRQTEIQRKAWDLIKGAREKRRALEREVAAHRADIERRELELRAQRAALEDVGRSELHKTSAEFEQVLGVRLGEIESEVFRRQAELDLRMDSLTKSGASAFHARRPPESGRAASANLSLEDLAALARLEVGEATGGESGRLETLQQEVETLRQAINRIDEEEIAPLNDPKEQFASLESRRMRLESQKQLADLLKSRLAENSGKLRDGSNGEGTPQAAAANAVESSER